MHIYIRCICAGACMRMCLLGSPVSESRRSQAASPPGQGWCAPPVWEDGTSKNRINGALQLLSNRSK